MRRPVNTPILLFIFNNCSLYYTYYIIISFYHLFHFLFFTRSEHISGKKSKLYVFSFYFFELYVCSFPLFSVKCFIDLSLKTSVFIRLPALREKFAQNWRIWWQSVNLPADFSPHFCWYIWWKSANLLTDLATVSRYAGRNPPHPHICRQTWWQSVNLPAEAELHERPTREGHYLVHLLIWF